MNTERKTMIIESDRKERPVIPIQTISTLRTLIEKGTADTPIKGFQSMLCVSH
jgi:hypothetical protein